MESSALVFSLRRLIVEYAAKQPLPAVYPFGEFADDGGLMAYGTDLKDLYHRRGRGDAGQAFCSAGALEIPPRRADA